MSLLSRPLSPYFDCSSILPTARKCNLPTEMWFDIFRMLPVHALCSVHSVSFLFHDISHPLLFHDFNLDPDQHNLSPEEFIERLDMYSAEPIASHVRKLSVSFQFGRWFRARSGGFITALSSPTPLIAPLLQTILNFHNLRILECTFRFNSAVHFADLGLQDLPNLQDLRIHGGAPYCPYLIPAKKIGVTHFSFTGIPSVGLEPRQNMRSFLSILYPETLSSLTLSPSYDCSPALWLAYDRDLFSTFRQLRTVTIGCDGPFLRPVHDFLVQLPALQDLIMSGEYRRCTEFEPTDDGPSLPLGLQSYTGPCEYIPLFLSGTACTRLTINACYTPEDLARALETTSYTSAVTDLSLLLPFGPFCGWESPRSLFIHFPRLATLRLIISDSPLDDDPDMCDFTETFDPEALMLLPEILTAVLRAPTELTRAVIEWDLSCDIISMLPALEDLHETVVRSLPQARKIVFERGARTEGTDESTDTSESGSDESMEGVEKSEVPFF
ncbi:hypothetical protein C8F04DRAFT_1395546 [Mycena alexandri]|uniref:F-box domain-containing protein n=1 Tax=Mycena alexandri TaxID=1745969 RepID=A0AAD6X2J6_9AGAR|nr:hypothetical protein C8F04DRAFT_1395546 [Mycena alexandri]